MLLATYGTFRKGQLLSYYLDDLRKAGTTEVVELPGVKLYVLGMAPGAKLTDNPKDKAVVELVEAKISDKTAAKLLELLDVVEGVPNNMYERNFVDTPKGRALIYTKCGSVEGCVEITDWVEWVRKSTPDKIRDMTQVGSDTQFVYI